MRTRPATARVAGLASYPVIGPAALRDFPAVCYVFPADIRPDI